MDIKRLIKGILSVRPKNRGREGMQTVCDREYRDTMCVFKY